MIDDNELHKEDDDDANENPYQTKNNAGEESDENPYTESVDNEIQVIQDNNKSSNNKHIILNEDDDVLT